MSPGERFTSPRSWSEGGNLGLPASNAGCGKAADIPPALPQLANAKFGRIFLAPARKSMDFDRVGKYEFSNLTPMRLDERKSLTSLLLRVIFGSYPSIPPDMDRESPASDSGYPALAKVAGRQSRRARSPHAPRL